MTGATVLGYPEHEGTSFFPPLAIRRPSPQHHDSYRCPLLVSRAGTIAIPGIYILVVCETVFRLSFFDLLIVDGRRFLSQSFEANRPPVNLVALPPGRDAVDGGCSWLTDQPHPHNRQTQGQPQGARRVRRHAVFLTQNIWFDLCCSSSLPPPRVSNQTRHSRHGAVTPVAEAIAASVGSHYCVAIFQQCSRAKQPADLCRDV